MNPNSHRTSTSMKTSSTDDMLAGGAGAVAAPEPASSPENSRPAELPLALTVQEASVALRLDPRTVRQMVRSGEIDGNQKGHAIRISRSSVLDWLCGKRRVPRSRSSR